MTGLILFGLLLAIAMIAMSIPPEKLPRRPTIRSAGPDDGGPAASEAGRRTTNRASLPRRWIRPGLIMTVLLIGAVGTGAALILRRSGPRATDVPRMAVLPFELVGPDAERYFAQGITEELTTRLGTLEGMELVSTSAVQGMRPEERTPERLGEALNVDFLLEGSVSIDRTGPAHRIRVRARMVDVRNAAQIWSDVYDENIERLFEVQGRIAERVAGVMSLNLVAAQREALSRARTSNIAAYDQYLLALSYRRAIREHDNAWLALGAFRRATDLDPDFAGAWAGQAAAHAWLADWHGYAGQLDSARIKLADAARLDPDDPDVLFATALIASQIDLDLDRARVIYENLETRVLSFRQPIVGAFLARLEWRRGRVEEALRIGRLTIRREPYLSTFNIGLAEYLLNVREYEEAEPLIARSAASGTRDPRNLLYAALLPVLRNGDTAESWRRVQAADPIDRRLLLSDGLHAESRSLLRIFAPRLDADAATLAASTRSRLVSAGAELARAILASGAGPSAEARAYMGSAVTALQAIVADEMSLTPASRITARCALAVALAGIDDAGAASALLDETLRTLPDPDDPTQQLEVLHTRAEVRAMAGDVEGARQAVTELLSRPSLLSAPLVSVDPLWAAARQPGLTTAAADRI